MQISAQWSQVTGNDEQFEMVQYLYVVLCIGIGIGSYKYGGKLCPQSYSGCLESHEKRGFPFLAQKKA